MMFEPASTYVPYSLRDPKLRELFALATETGATMTTAVGEASTEESQEDTEQAAQEPQEGTETNDEGEAPPSFDELMSSLPEDQQRMIRAELDSRDQTMRKLRSEARNLRTRAQEAEAKAASVDEAQNAKKSAEQKADEVSATMRSENEGLRKRLVTQEIKVRAAAKFADPDDPAELLAGQIDELLDDDLEPDTQAIDDVLEELLSRKPHLAKSDPKPRVPAPTKAQGSSGTPTTTAGSKGLAEAQRRFGKTAAVAS